ncbi:hypothetical protein C8R44DRAFT_737042 [Mycena epipterygia]|nr:hypothetical protein C8R44DRAFT_737042 [Mycena epipterygia]
MFNFSRLVVLVIAVASIVSATALNIDLNAGAVDYAPVNAFPLGNVVNEQACLSHPLRPTLTAMDSGPSSRRTQRGGQDLQDPERVGAHIVPLLRLLRLRRQGPPLPARPPPERQRHCVHSEGGMGFVKSVIPSRVPCSAPSSVYIAALLSSRAEALSPPGLRLGLPHLTPLLP